jgi:hypothetical protein
LLAIHGLYLPTPTDSKTEYCAPEGRRVDM